MKRLLHAVFMPVLLLISLSSLAQDRVVTGKVTDSKDGTPIVGASVQPKGSRTGTSTAADGSFRISIPSGTNTLVVSSAEFERQEIDISGKSTVDVSLTATAAGLTEVVVIGYGTARKKDLTGAVASVKAKDFNQGVINAPDQLLQNKVAGLEVTNTSGQPGAAATVQIRGSSSIRSSNNPLYVVDGVLLDGRTARPNLGNAFGSTPNSNPLLFINPNDISQIDVLKDASSAAIYGSRGANGVILITTKKGTSGPMKVDVGVNYGVFAGYMKKFEVLDAGEYREALGNKNGVPTGLDGGQDVDALKELTNSDISQNYNLALSGGNETGKFRASFLGSRNQGFLKKSLLDKYIASFAGNNKFWDNKLTIDFGLIAGNFGEDLTSVSNTAGSTGNIISSALSWNPTQPLITNGLYNFPSNGSGNPLAFNDAFFDESSVDFYLGNISAALKLAKNLEYKLLYGINSQKGNRKLNIEGWLQGFPGLSGQGNAAILNARLRSSLFTHTLSYIADITPNLTVDAVVGYEYFKTDYSGDGVVGSGYNTNLSQTARIPIKYTSVFQNALNQDPVFTYADPTAELQSYFARGTFNFMNKYLLTATLRADGSSKFGENNRYGYFPSVGFKWVASSEEFLKQSTIFSDLALRLSYGITGNQEFPAGSSQEQFGLVSFNNAPQVVNGNPNLKWESTQAIDIGLEFAFDRGKYYGSFDYYRKNTSDILFQTNAIQPAPSSVSFINLPDANLINSGFEISLGANILKSKRISWDVNFNLAHNKNKIEKFLDPNTGLPLLVETGTINGQGVSGTLAQVMANNQVVNVYYLKPFEGFDANGNQKIGATPSFAGNPNPTTLAGFSTTVKYDRFTFGLNMGGAFGFLIYNNTATAVTNIAGLLQGRNIDKAAYESEEQPSSGVGASTRFLEKGNYFKLRNATLRYDVGNIGKYMKNFSAFVTGSNLLVFTKFTGFDPEVNIDKSNNNYPSRSIEYVPYPTPRTIVFGFNFTL